MFDLWLHYVTLIVILVNSSAGRKFFALTPAKCKDLTRKLSSIISEIHTCKYLCYALGFANLDRKQPFIV